MKALIFSAAFLWLGLGVYFAYKVFQEETAPQPPTPSQPSMSAPAAKAPSVAPEILEEYKTGAVKNTIVKNRASLVKCYDVFTETKPKELNGAIVLDWVIQDQGEVSRLGVVRDDLGDETLTKCVTDAMKTWLFPPIPGVRPVYVEHTFNFGEPPKPSIPEMVNVKDEKK